MAAAAAATTGIPARPSRREAAAKDTATTICGNGHKRMEWWMLPPVLALVAICTHATAMAIKAKNIARSASPRAKGVSARASRKA